MSVVSQKPKNLNFAANLSFMFQEHSDILKRYEAAKLAGFKAVETAFLYELPFADVVKAKVDSGLQQVLINAYPGDLKAGDLGLAALPSRVLEFRDGLRRSIELCKALNCKRLHIMAGKVTSGLDRREMEKTFLENLKYASVELAKEDIIGLIEPISNIPIPGYFLNSFDAGVKYVKEVNSQFLRLQLDLYHLQFINGNLTNNIKELLPIVGHIQIAQVPDRHEPNSAGEIDYKYIFNLLQDLGYEGWIGLEYIPKDSTTKGLKWFEEYKYTM